MTTDSNFRVLVHGTWLKVLLYHDMDMDMERVVDKGEPLKKYIFYVHWPIVKKKILKF